MPAPIRRLGAHALEWLVIVALAYAYAGTTLLDFDASRLRQSGEHNESATLPLLAEIGMSRHGEIPLWNPYMLTGFPHAGDLLSHFWHPVSTIPVLLWGGINGLKVSAFLAFLVAGLGQWMFGYVFGLGRTFRLWSASLFMLSGGLALLWYSGWYGLLLGAAWFPWCFALYWSALRHGTWRAIGLASAANFMIVSSGGGYFPLYLAVCLATLTVMAWLSAPSPERPRKIRIAALVAFSTAALSAVVLLPYADVFRHAERTVTIDVVQQSSQSIPYGLINYIVSTPAWFRTEILGTSGGWTWFYIGWLPVGALMLVPLALHLGPSRAERWGIVTLGVLFLVLMMWFANRVFPVRPIYDFVPALYALRFPNRLLIVAAAPLLVLSGLAMQKARWLSMTAAAGRTLQVRARSWRSPVVRLRDLVSLAWILGLVITSADVYAVNRQFAFADQALNRDARTALQWLKTHDSSLYYVDLNGLHIRWDWLPAAFDLEMPVVNFHYSRRLLSQRPSEASHWIKADAKYLLYAPDREPSGEVRRLQNLADLVLWQRSQALPYAFSVPTSAIGEPARPPLDRITPLPVRLDGPNRIVVTGAPRSAAETLVVLASDFPGWALTIDAQRAPVNAVHGYLSAEMASGERTYVFEFRPVLPQVGLAISLVSGVLLLLVSFRRPRQAEGS